MFNIVSVMQQYVKRNKRRNARNDGILEWRGMDARCLATVALAKEARVRLAGSLWQPLDPP